MQIARRAEAAESGQPLDNNTRAFMESHFEHDFSSVRLHTGVAAAQSARDMDARAYTSRNHITFGAGEYDPSTPRGQHLLVHELAHVAQQNHAAPSENAPLTSRGDAREAEADRAVSDISAGRTPETPRQTGAAIARQWVTPLAPVKASLPPQSEMVVESFLRQMWEKQSGQTENFRVTPKVLEGLNYISPGLGAAGAITSFKTADEFLAVIRKSIPATIDGNVIKVLDNLPKQETKLADARKADPDADPATPNLGGQPSAVPKSPGDVLPGPDKPKELSDAAAAALKQAFDQFSKTELGKQLKESAKSYVFSKEGIPFDVLVVADVITFVAGNDPKIPSIPEIPIGDGIKIKIDYSGRVSDLPPLVRDLVRGHSTQPPGKEETKIGLSVTLTDDAVVALAKGVGNFFAEAAKWFARGVVNIGTTISRAGINIGQALLAAVGGGALGALIGAAAGGGKGALIGAGIGAAAAFGLSIVGDLIRGKPKAEPAQ